MVTPCEGGYCGLSTDVKPIKNVKNGKEFWVIDYAILTEEERRERNCTSPLYVFDEEHKKWVPQ